MGKKVAICMISLAVVGLVLATYTVKVTATVNDYYQTVEDTQVNPQQISMPTEYINYTIFTVNGSLWASIDGTYPMQIPQAWVGQELSMVYPTPPGVVNISLELDGQEVGYSNLTQSQPYMLHYTYLGEWPMILFAIQPTSPTFVLTIHYQHPILQANGTYMFLYDLNINPYLSNSTSQSTAHFNILFQTNCSDINVYSVPSGSSTPHDDTKIPVNFTKSKDNGMQTAAFNITSSYSNPLPGDELVTFHRPQAQVPEFPTWAIIFSLAMITEVSFILRYKRVSKQKNSARFYVGWLKFHAYFYAVTAHLNVAALVLARFPNIIQVVAHLISEHSRVIRKNNRPLPQPALS